MQRKDQLAGVAVIRKDGSVAPTLTDESGGTVFENYYTPEDREVEYTHIAKIFGEPTMDGEDCKLLDGLWVIQTPDGLVIVQSDTYPGLKTHWRIRANTRKCAEWVKRALSVKL